MSSRQFIFLALAPMALIAQEARDVVPLKNWSNPLYWRASQAEREATATPTPQLQFSPTQVSRDALSFVAITPCRLLDTRGTATGFSSGAPWNAPIAAAGALTIPVQTDAGNAACGTIPSIAQAYSVNVTLVPVSSGQVNFLSIWPAGATQPVVATMNDKTGLILANAAIVPAGTPSGGISVFNSGPAATNVVIDMNGFFAPPSDLNSNTAIGDEALASNTTGVGNTAMGVGALEFNTVGVSNTAIGEGALLNNTSGIDNTATGVSALLNNTSGTDNTATGLSALGSNTTGSHNTAIGLSALGNNSTGNDNTATGESALLDNTSGGANTASGQSALRLNTTGGANTSVGASALQSNTTGSNNTAVGQVALFSSTTAFNNTAVGAGAMEANSGGGDNTALGQNALLNNTVGAGNIAIGQSAGGSAPNSNSNSIYIGSLGTGSDASGTIRIGSGTQSSFFVGAVNGVITGNNDAVAVVIDSNGQLGTISSSARFKEDIHDMGDASDRLLDLHPVTYRYKQPYKDGSKPIDYGLIAEEVAQVYPDLVVKGADGNVQTVQYQKLTPMLLNELQKQAAQNREQADKIRSLEQRLAAIEALLPAAEPVR